MKNSIMIILLSLFKKLLQIISRCSPNDQSMAVSPIYTPDPGYMSCTAESILDPSPSYILMHIEPQVSLLSLISSVSTPSLDFYSQCLNITQVSLILKIKQTHPPQLRHLQ